MEQESPQTRSRLLLLALSGVFAAFAWIVLSMVLGFGASDAHADDADGTGGLLDGAASVVENVAETGAAVAQAPVAQVVAAAQPVTAVVVEVAAPVTTPLQSGVVAPLVAPLTEIVSGVPVVGEVSSALGVDTVLNELAGTAGAAAETIIKLPGRVIESAPGIGLSAAASATKSAEMAAVTRTVLEAEASDSRTSVGTIDGVSVSLTSAAVLVATALVAGSPVGSLPDLLSSMPPLSSAMTSSGGAGLGLTAVLALGLFAAHHSWVQRRGLLNDKTPPAPAFLTDVSPD